MTRNRLVLMWVFSVLVLAVTAAQSWAKLEISLGAGGGLLFVNGYTAFPVAGTLIGLQLVAVVLTFLISRTASRYVSTALAALMSWNFIDVLLNSTLQIANTAQRELTDKTGVVQDLANSEFLISSSTSWWPVAYLIAMSLNIAALTMVAYYRQSTDSVSGEEVRRDLPEDLWSNQK